MSMLTSLNDAHRRLRETVTNLHQAQAAKNQISGGTYIHHAISDIERVQRVIEHAKRMLSETEKRDPQ